MTRGSPTTADSVDNEVVNTVTPANTSTTLAARSHHGSRHPKHQSVASTNPPPCATGIPRLGHRVIRIHDCNNLLADSPALGHMALSKNSLCSADYAIHTQIAHPASAVTTAVIKGDWTLPGGAVSAWNGDRFPVGHLGRMVRASSVKAPGSQRFRSGWVPRSKWL